MPSGGIFKASKMLRFWLGGDPGAENRTEFHGKQDAQLVWLEVQAKIYEMVWLEGVARAVDRMELQG